MAIHPELKLDGPVMDEACSYACDHGHVFVIDIGNVEVTAGRFRNFAIWLKDTRR